MGLPVVFYSHAASSPEIVGLLRAGYRESYQVDPDFRQQGAWKGSVDALVAAFRILGESYPVIAEYPLFDHERPDFLVVGREKVLVVECKGWTSYRRVNSYCVEVDERWDPDPCYQLENYVNKLRFFHSAASTIGFEGVVYTYNTDSYADGCVIASTPGQLASLIRRLGEPGIQEQVEQIVDGRFVINKTLVSLVEEYKEKLVEGAAKTLATKGYGLSREQMLVVEQVLKAVESGERHSFLVRGESGSGKTLVALTLLLEAVGRGYKAVLGYRNNRLINALRRALKTSVRGVDPSALLVFYSTGAQAGFRGLGEKNFPAEKWGDIELAIYDEAQRMTEDVVRVTSQRSRVSVYFYDDQQVLTGSEAGTRQTFMRYLESPHEAVLSTRFRNPGKYLESVKNVLEGKSSVHYEYDVKIYSSIVNLLHDLEDLRSRGLKTAIVCAFTESEGYRRHPESPKNIRLGYPLQSGFDLYKGLNIEVRWLMDEKNQYPKYWSGKLDSSRYCASVYGAQGFEADYVAVVWGRDLVCRDGAWTINPDIITDSVGGRDSLKAIAHKDKDKAMTLLKNRYYVMLSRGIVGTYLFFEDAETRDYVASLLTPS